MRTILSIYRNYRPVHWYKYILDLNHKRIRTNSKEEIKMLIDLYGLRYKNFRRLTTHMDDIQIYQLIYEKE